MSRFPDALILDQAISWHLRLKDADVDAWDEFAEWLESDPAHNDAYEAVVDEDERLAPLLEKADFSAEQDVPEDRAVGNEAASVLQPGTRQALTRRKAWRWGALAASIAVAGLLAIQLFQAGSDTYAVETVLGQKRTIALADGSEIMLNGGSKVSLDRNDERTAKLLRGEARFKVRHDDSDPFTVVAGDRRLVDIGTVFNVVHTGKELRVAVAEGAVRYEDSKRKIDLAPGDALAADAGGSIRISKKPAASIGSWADGVLVYDQTPLGLVSEDLSRSLGVTVTLPSALQATSFSGVIQTDGGKDAVRERLEQLLGVPIEADGSNWTVQQ